MDLATNGMARRLRAAKPSQPLANEAFRRAKPTPSSLTAECFCVRGGEVQPESARFDSAVSRTVKLTKDKKKKAATAYALLGRA